jgi:hypothetical protein
MNKRAKGNKYELKAQRELEREGFLVQRAPPSYRWNKQTDLFRLFDIIAVKKNTRTRYIQVKANRTPTQKEKESLNGFRHYCYFELPKGIFKFGEVIQIGEVEWWCYWEKGKRKNKQGWEKIVF